MENLIITEKKNLLFSINFVKTYKVSTTQKSIVFHSNRDQNRDEAKTKGKNEKK